MSYTEIVLTGILIFVAANYINGQISVIRSWRQSKRNMEAFIEREDIRDRAIEKLIKSEMAKDG